MSQAKARAMLVKSQMEAQRESREEYEDRVEQNERARNWSTWGGLIGSIGLPLAFASGGLTLGVGALLAGAGSRAGQEFGEQLAGGVQEGPLTRRGFGSEQRLAYEQNLEDVYGGWDEKQWMDAGQAAITAALMGGAQEAFTNTAMPPNISEAVKAAEAAGHVEKAAFMSKPYSIFSRMGETLGKEYKLNPFDVYSK